MPENPVKLIVAEIVGLMLLGIVFGVLRGFSLTLWALYIPVIIVIGVLGGLASWYGLRRMNDS